MRSSSRLPGARSAGAAAAQAESACGRSPLAAVAAGVVVRGARCLRSKSSLSASSKAVPIVCEVSRADHIESFRTMMVPGFPNFFMLLGPNSATGHTSALIMIESCARYVMQCLELMDRKNIAHMEPKAALTARYNARLQRDMNQMVFSGGCNAWYTDDEDRNFTLWPYSALRFLIEQWRPKRSDFSTSS